jgi:hypothetical protein
LASIQRLLFSAGTTAKHTAAAHWGGTKVRILALSPLIWLLSVDAQGTGRYTGICFDPALRRRLAIPYSTRM